MENKFFNTFKTTDKILNTGELDLFKSLPTELFDLIKTFGGFTFNNGLYRIHSFQSSLHWSILIGDYFNSYQNQIYPFGFDWMGRQFCLSANKKTLLYMFDPSTGEGFTLQQSIQKFHEDDLVDDTENMLSVDMFNKVLSHLNMEKLGFDDCLGYKTPLFLGGKDSPDNYEVQNLEVYWHIQNQLLKKIKDLPEGTNIKNIKIE